MITKNLTKLMIAVALTLAVTLGSGIAAEEMGISITPVVSACGHAGGGGC